MNRWSTAEPFSDDQARCIRESAKLPSQASDQPADFDEAIVWYFNFRQCHKTTKENLKLWRELRSNATALGRKLRALDPFHAELAKFILRCDSEIRREIDKIEKGLPERERLEPVATKLMALVLRDEFVRLFCRRPTLSREGAFHHFVEAFMEAARKNLTRSDARYLPTAETVMRHYAALPSHRNPDLSYLRSISLLTPLPI